LAKECNQSLPLSLPHGSQRPTCLAGKIPFVLITDTDVFVPFMDTSVLKVLRHTSWLSMKEVCGTRNGREGQGMYPHSLCTTLLDLRNIMGVQTQPNDL